MFALSLSLSVCMCMCVCVYKTFSGHDTTHNDVHRTDIQHDVKDIGVKHNET
jgi:hypothetical protein